MVTTGSMLRLCSVFNLSETVQTIRVKDTRRVTNTVNIIPIRRVQIKRQRRRLLCDDPKTVRLSVTVQRAAACAVESLSDRFYSVKITKRAQ